jgi:hypothetical protein
MDHRFGLYALVVFCIPVLLFCVPHWLWNSRRERVDGKPPRGADLSTFIAILVAMLCGACLSYPLGWCFWHNDRAQAIAFADRVVPRLETFRAAHQRYPERISEVLDADETLPRLFETSAAGYDTRYLFYELWIRDSSSWSGGMSRSSITKSWVDWTSED